MLEGEGAGTILQPSVALGGGVVQGVSGSRIVIRDLTIAAVGIAPFGVSLQNCTYCVVENLFISGTTQDGVYLSSSQDVDVRSCQMLGCMRNGVAHGSGTPGLRIRVMGCTLQQCGHYGVDLEPASESAIVNCQAVACSNGGFVITGEADGPYLHGNRIENCTATGNGGPGISLGRSIGCLISGCVSSQNQYGIYIGSNCVGTQVVSNHTIGNAASGIHVFAGADRSVISGNIACENGEYGIATGGNMTTITGNLCRGNATSYYQVRDGILVATCLGCTITGNVCIDSVGQTALTGDASAGSKTLQVADVRDFYAKQFITVTGATSEDAVVVGTTASPPRLYLLSPLAYSHTVASGAKAKGRAGQRYGIYLQRESGSGDRHVVTGNVVTGNGTSQILDATLKSCVSNNILWLEDTDPPSLPACG
ncbi:MAG: right-handed parallel beta-helix repeat-containing protein [bacterium]